MYLYVYNINIIPLYGKCRPTGSETAVGWKSVPDSDSVSESGSDTVVNFSIMENM